MLNLSRRLRVWKRSLKRSVLTERVRRLLQMRTDPRLMLFGVALCLALLSGCASKPQRPLGEPPKELMVPPPPPQAATNLLEAILRKGQTSAPTSTP